MQPELRLESVLRRDASIDEARCSACLHAGVRLRRGPNASTCSWTKDGRLAVIELKADDDLHPALQGLDYWPRASGGINSRIQIQMSGLQSFSGTDTCAARLAMRAAVASSVAPALRASGDGDGAALPVTAAWTGLCGNRMRGGAKEGEGGLEKAAEAAGRLVEISRNGRVSLPAPTASGVCPLNLEAHSHADHPEGRELEALLPASQPANGAQEEDSSR